MKSSDELIREFGSIRSERDRLRALRGGLLCQRAELVSRSDYEDAAAEQKAEPWARFAFPQATQAEPCWKAARRWREGHNRAEFYFDPAPSEWCESCRQRQAATDAYRVAVRQHGGALRGLLRRARTLEQAKSDPAVVAPRDAPAEQSVHAREKEPPTSLPVVEGTPPAQEKKVEGVRLPAVVEGHAMIESIEGFERRCLIHIARLQENNWPDRDSIEIIAQAVRCAREYSTLRQLRAAKATAALEGTQTLLDEAVRRARISCCANGLSSRPCRTEWPDSPAGWCDTCLLAALAVCARQGQRVEQDLDTRGDGERRAAGPTGSTAARNEADRRPLAKRLGCMADAVVHAKTGPRHRFFTRECADEIALLLREAERWILEGR